MRQLTNLELDFNFVSGAGAVTYPPAVSGYEIIGWEETFLGYDETHVTDQGFFTQTVYVYRVPVYDITPVYAPITYYIS